MTPTKYQRFSPSLGILSLLYLAGCLHLSFGLVLPKVNNGYRIHRHARLSSPGASSLDGTNSDGNKEISDDDNQLPLPPGRARWPILGDTIRLLNPKSMASYQVDSRAKFGPVWKTNVLFKRAVFVSGGKALEELAKEERIKPTSASFPPHHQKLFGPSSIIVTSGEPHDRLRRMIQPALAANPQVYKPLIETEVDTFVQEYRVQQGSFAAVDLLRRFTVRVSLRVLLGSSLSEEIMNDMIQDIGIWSRGLVSAPLTFLPWTAAGKAMRARKRLAAQFQTWINQERMVEPSPDDGMLKTKSLLHRLVHSTNDKNGENGHLSDEAIIDNVLTIIFAGSDTTASVLVSAFLQLAKDPALEERLREVLSSASRDEATAHIQAFIAETQRCYPSAPFTMRVVDDQDLHVGGYRIPRGWLAVYAIAGTLLADDDMYRTPDTFDIGRWLEPAPAEVVGLKLSKSKPEIAPVVWAFGGGKRMCPGKSLSFLESTVLFEAMLGTSERQNLRWKLDPPNQDTSYRYTPGFFPVDGLQIRLVQ